MASNFNKTRTIDFSKPRLLDGAMGTELLKHGWAFGTCLEAWALDNPHIVEQIHRDYIAAGAEIINTCTFGANRIRLEIFGMGERVLELNRELARIAVSLKGADTLVAGNVGPTGRSKASGGSLPPSELEEVFSEQVRTLEKAGVDLIAIETMTDLEEATAALKASLAATTLPVTVSLAFDDNGRLKDGVPPETACRELQAIGASAVGCNCWPVGDALCNVIARMKKVATVALIAQPSAGLPKERDGGHSYPLGAAEFVRLAHDLMEAGAVMVGGCCGTTPEYIRLLRQSPAGG